MLLVPLSQRDKVNEDEDEDEDVDIDENVDENLLLTALRTLAVTKFATPPAEEKTLRPLCEKKSALIFIVSRKGR